MFVLDVDTVTLDIGHLDFEPRCEAKAHASGAWDHDPEQSASFLVVAPCGASRMMCAAWVASTAPHQMLMCVPGCGENHPFTKVRFIPL